MAFCLGGARQVAGAARIVERELEKIARREVGEDHLGLCPRERAGDADQIEAVRGRHGTDP